MATSDKDKRKRKEEHSKKYERPFADNRPFDVEGREGSIARNTKEGLSLVGKAYFFFDCEAQKEEITRQISEIRKHPSYSERLELSLIEGPKNLRGYWDLKALAAEPRQAQRKYVLEGTHLDATNREVAEELKEITYSMFSLNLLDKEGKFKGSIHYKERGKYIPLKKRKTF